MKHYFKITAVLVSMVFAVGANADDGRLVLGTPDGSTSVSLNTISKITFDGTMMTIDSTDGLQQVDVLSLSNIKFDFSTSSAESIEKELEGSVQISVSAGVVTVTVPQGMATVDVYGMQGYKLSSASAESTVTVDLNPLAPGVYVIKANNKTIKFTRQ